MAALARGCAVGRDPHEAAEAAEAIRREYPAVAPLGGSYAGTGTKDLAVVVQITRVA